MRILSRICSIFAGTALAALVLMTIASVFARYLFNAPFHWTEEVSGLLMIWIVMIGAISTERDDQHLSIPVLMEQLPVRAQAAVAVLTGLLSIAALGYCGYLGYVLAENSQYKLTGVLQFSWFWIDLAVPFGAAGLVIFMAAKVIRELRILVKGEQ